MELIDKNRILQRVNERCHWAKKLGRSSREYQLALNDIDSMPTIDAEPVKHGRWIYEGHTGEPSEPFYSCSVCQYVNYKASKFCPNCGAKMDGGENEVATSNKRE